MALFTEVVLIAFFAADPFGVEELVEFWWNQLMVMLMFFGILVSFLIVTVHIFCTAQAKSKKLMKKTRCSCTVYNSETAMYFIWITTISGLLSIAIVILVSRFATVTVVIVWMAIWGVSHSICAILTLFACRKCLKQLRTVETLKTESKERKILIRKLSIVGIYMSVIFIAVLAVLVLVAVIFFVDMPAWYVAVFGVLIPFLLMPLGLMGPFLFFTFDFNFQSKFPSIIKKVSLSSGISSKDADTKSGISSQDVDPNTVESLEEAFENSSAFL
jgi:hypothetical protein